MEVGSGRQPPNATPIAAHGLTCRLQVCRGAQGGHRVDCEPPPCRVFRSRRRLVHWLQRSLRNGICSPGQEHDGMRTGSATYGSAIGSGPLVGFLRRDYIGRLRWPIRIGAWMASALAASLAGRKYALLGPVAVEVVFLVVVLARYPAEKRGRRRELDDSRPRPRRVPASDVEALRREARRQAVLPRVASPGGWTPPQGVLPAWNWAPASGMTPRLDRVPWWVRMWYYTPLVDRYAHAWMWQRGGWDVVPPEAWSAPSS